MQLGYHLHGVPNIPTAAVTSIHDDHGMVPDLELLPTCDIDGVQYGHDDDDDELVQLFLRGVFLMTDTMVIL